MARKYRTDLDAGTLRDVFSYNVESGVFTHRASGRVTTSKSPYIVICVKRKAYLAHRLAWLYVYGEWPANQIDHIDGNPRNNALANLREVSDIENHQNTKCRGFYLDPRRGRYRAVIKVRKQKINLGSFATAEAARQAYEAASIKYFGEFSGIHRGMK